MSERAKLFNYIALPILLIVDIVYMILSGLWLKGVTSFIFVIIGVVNLLLAQKEGSGKSNFKYLVCIGLFICFVADIILNIWFMIGAIIFAVGHIFYFVAYLTLCKFSWKDIVCGLCVAVPSVLVLVLYPFDYQGMFPVIVIYAMIISFMVGKAISLALFSEISKVSKTLILTGSILFFLSDLALLFCMFGNGGVVADNICLLTYYPGQGLLACSVYFTGNKKQEMISSEK